MAGHSAYTVMRSSTLRAQLPTSSRRQQQTRTTLPPRLRHLQKVAAWASVAVPPLGAFLGSSLASACESIGSLVPASACQRCESLLEIGSNCSLHHVRIKKSKKHGRGRKRAGVRNKSIIFFCHYCQFKNVRPRAYLKSKQNNQVTLLEPCHNHTEEKVKQEMKTPNTKLSSSPTPSSSLVGAGSTGRKSKRKGWRSLKELASFSSNVSPANHPLKELASSSSMLAPAGNRPLKELPSSSSNLSPIGNRALSNLDRTKSPLSLQSRILDLPRATLAMPHIDLCTGVPASKNEENVLSIQPDKEQCRNAEEPIQCTSGDNTLLHVPHCPVEMTRSEKQLGSSTISVSISSIVGNRTDTGEGDVEPVVDASLPTVTKNGREDLELSSVEEERMSSSAKRRRLDAGLDRKPMISCARIKACKLVGLSSFSRLAETTSSPPFKDSLGNMTTMESLTRKKPLYRRVGRRWLTCCNSGRKLRWRVV